MSAESTDHRNLCRVAAHWLLHEQRCYAACYEVQHHGGQVDAVGITLPEVEADLEERYRLAHLRWKRDVALLDDPTPDPKRAAELRARLDWLAGRNPLGLKAGLPEPDRNDARYRPSTSKRSKPRVIVVEAKRTRADLRADLRERKMLGYEDVASHCFLAGTAEALDYHDDGGPRPWVPRSQAEIDRTLEGLAALGLPPKWGVALFYQAGPRTWAMSILRRGLAVRELGEPEVRLWGARMLRSMSWRAVSRFSPLSDEVDDL